MLTRLLAHRFMILSPVKFRNFLNALVGVHLPINLVGRAMLVAVTIANIHF